jgi:hypothetical protein
MNLINERMKALRLAFVETILLYACSVGPGSLNDHYKELVDVNFVFSKSLPLQPRPRFVTRFVAMT